jgi:hypothetical protein
MCSRPINNQLVAGLSVNARSALRGDGELTRRSRATVLVIRASRHSHFAVGGAVRALIIDPERVRRLRLELAKDVVGHLQKTMSAIGSRFYGAVWYRLLLDEPLDDGFMRGMIELRVITVWL